MASIREIALKSGLSTATVSNALRGKGTMSAATRRKVTRIAAAMGYQPMPLVSKALSLVRQPVSARYRETLAFITESPVAGGLPSLQEIFKIARERAFHLGYKLEEFIVSGKSNEQRQVSRMLRARGIRGVIFFTRLKHHHPRVFFDWEHFAVVEIGRTIAVPRNLHHVERGVYAELIEALHLLKKVGYRRIGLAVEPGENINRLGIYSAATLMLQQNFPSDQRIPPFTTFGEWSGRQFALWYAKYRPDVLVVHDVKTVPGWLQNMGLSVPRDVSIFYCNVPMHTQLSGLRANLQAMAESSVEMISVLLDRNELGLAAHPRTWQVDDLWQAGNTLDRSIAKYLSEEGYILSRSWFHPSKG